MSEIAISLKNVSKYYKLYQEPKDRLKEALHPFKKKYHKEFYALKDINLDIKKGEILGIVGKNGSGKSTLLKLIIGVLIPNSGAVKVNGKISALLELGAGFNPEFTGLQNIYFYATILGLTNKEIDERLENVVSFADIGEYIQQPLKTYSSGMKARLGFAVAVHIDPEILILDEVLAVGDELFKRKCYAKMEEFFKGGKTIIYVSHDANSVNKLCTRAVFINGGRILLDADTKMVTSYYQKYLFSVEGKKQQVLEEIDRLSAHTANASLLTKSIPEPLVRPSRSKANDDSYLPGLIPKGTVEYKNYDARIVQVHIVTQEGRKVNVLKQDRVYLYRYRVVFNMDAIGVSFGTQIKDINGMRITGAALNNASQNLDVFKGMIFDVEWQFTCRLLAGTYFTNTGVSAIIDGERTFLHRIVDAVAFKVLPEENSLYAGIVHLNQHISYKAINNDSPQ